MPGLATQVFPGSVQRLDESLQVDDFVNNSSTTVAVGEVLMVDPTVPHTNGYRSLITPTTAELNTGDFWVVMGLGPAGTGANATVVTAPPQLVQLTDQGPNVKFYGQPTDYLNDNASNPLYADTTPSRTDYDALVTAGDRLVAQDSTWDVWMGNIYVRETFYVTAQ